MADDTPAPLFAYFDGEGIDSKTYALGDRIDRDAHSEGVLAFLVAQGRIGSVPPSSGPLIPNDKPLDTMNRSELEATARAEMPLDKVSDDDLRAGIERARAEKAEADGTADDDTGEKPLGKMTTAELTDVAASEGVTFGEDVKTNADRAAAIQAKRDAK